MEQQHRKQSLRCGCGSTQFYGTFELTYAPSIGTVQENPRYRCVACGEISDTRHMLVAVRRQHLTEELAKIQEELDGNATGERGTVSRQNHEGQEDPSGVPRQPSH